MTPRVRSASVSAATASAVSARRRVGVVALALAAVLGPVGTVLLPASSASGVVSIDPPADARAGTVVVSGTATDEPGGTTSVLYVVDATRSTGTLQGIDCNGSGAVGPDDDLNADGVVGDVLDCEVAGVQALNRSLATTTGVQAGLVAFSGQAAAADLDPVGSATFLPPGFTGGDAVPRLQTVVGSVQRNRIGLYDVRDLGASGSGTAFTSAVSVALDTLATAPPGPKVIMFLSDGLSGIDDALLARLGSSGVQLRSFGIGAGASCTRSGSLFKMAAATGEACQVVAQPAALATQLSGSQPDAVSGVTVTIGSVAVAATIDAVGGWKAGFTLGAGTYTATARATLSSGAVRTTQRSFTVAASGAATDPPTGTVAPGPGALRATALQVTRPAPTRLRLPARVTGRAGRPVDGLTPTEALAGSRVMLQARTGSGSAWTTVTTSRVDAKGRFDLRWKPRARWASLRVSLEAPAGFAGSVAAVAQPDISACKVTGKKRWSVACRTTARSGSPVRLLDGRTVLDRAKVRRGTFRLAGTGPVAGTRIEVTRGSRKVRLTL